MAARAPAANLSLGKAAQVAARSAALQAAFSLVLSPACEASCGGPARLFLCKHGACFNQISSSAFLVAWSGCSSINGAGLLLPGAPAGSRDGLASSCGLRCGWLVFCGSMPSCTIAPLLSPRWAVLPCGIGLAASSKASSLRIAAATGECSLGTRVGAGRLACQQLGVPTAAPRTASALILWVLLGVAPLPTLGPLGL